MQLRPRRQGLHHSCCSKKTLVAAAATAFLLCVSPAVSSSRHIPAINRVSNRIAGRSFVSPRKSSESSRLPLVHPPAAALEASASPPHQASPTSLSFSAASEEESPVPETSVTTTSFFKFPCETTGEQEPLELTSKKTLSLFRLRQHPSQAHVQRSFVVSLMALAGFVEGFCIRKHGCFPNLMTGTILKVAEAVGNLNFSGAGIHVSMIAFYIAGGYFFSKWKSNNKDSNKNKNKIEQTKSALTAVSVISSIFLILSDLLTGIPPLKMPLLAAGFGVINSGTVDVGAGVTFALTGHVNKIGQGMATGGLAKPKDVSKTSAYRTSVQGVAAFTMTALLANLVCGALETKTGGPLGLLGKLPIGTTMLAAYSWIFHRYIKASEKVAFLEGAKTA